MYKFLITGKNQDRVYDKIFDIIQKHSTFFRICTENEYETQDGYVIEFKDLPSNAKIEINELKNVIEL
jgi:hypothetical protein